MIKQSFHMSISMNFGTPSYVYIGLASDQWSFLNSKYISIFLNFVTNMLLE